MSWDRLIQTDDLRRGILVFTDAYGNSSTYSGGPIIGSSRVTLCNRTRKFHPGKASLNPVDHRSFVSECPSVTARCSRYSPSNVTWTVKGPIAAVLAYGNVSSTLPVPTPVTDKELTALYNTFNKVLQPQVDVGMMLGEAKETLSMLRSPFSLFPKLIQQCRKPRTVRGSDIKYAANAWLTHRYGLMPLMMDVDTIRRAYLKGLYRHGGLRHSTSRVPISDSVSSFTTSSTLLNNVAFRWCFQQTTKTFAASTILFRYNDLGPNLGLSIYDLPNLIWELVPYSFAVDWFLNIGSWLRTVVPNPRIEKLGSCTSTKRETTTVIDLLDCHPDTQFGRIDMVCSGRFTSKLTSYIRGPGSTLPQFPVVDFEFRSLKHVADSLALTWQRLPKLPSHK